MKNLFNKCILVISCFILTQTAHSKIMNIKIDPLLALVSIYDGAIEFYVSDKITVGPKLQYFNISGTGLTYKSFSYGGTLNYYLDKADADSWVLTATAYTGKFEFALDDYKYETDITRYGGLFGYQWMWSNFNINLKLGYLMSNLSDASLTLSDTSGTTTEQNNPFSGGSTTWEFSFGYSF